MLISIEEFDHAGDGGPGSPEARYCVIISGKPTLWTNDAGQVLAAVFLALGVTGADVSVGTVRREKETDNR